MTNTITQNEVLAIFRRHGFADDTPEKTTVGFRNQVYLGEHAVLKVYGEDNVCGYQTERWFNETAKPAYAPQMIANGENWILLERIHGIGLFRLWRDLDDPARERLVAEIARIALAVNDVPLAGSQAFLPYRDAYGAALIADIDRLAAHLTNNSGIPADLAAQVTAYAHRHAAVMDDTTLFLVYNDLHFDNLLVTKEGRVVLLDYEMLAVGPRDLVLDVWQRMLIHPFTYANEDDHPYTHPDDYRNLLVWMQKYAPQLFSHPQVRRRVNLYAIRYELDLLCDYPMAKWPIERLQRYLREDLW